jgi:hypothetical protein
MNYKIGSGITMDRLNVNAEALCSEKIRYKVLEELA